MSFWDVVWFIFISFAFVAYLMVVFSIIADLFRDQAVSGVVKAIWIVALVVFPLVTSLVYVIARGRGMTERAQGEAAQRRREQEAYLRELAAESSSSPAQDIARAREMLDAGTITQGEYERLKEKALV